MKLSKHLRFIAYEIFSNYCRYDEDYQGWWLEIENVPETDLQRLASSIYLENPDYAFEATSVENDSFDNNMVPSLITYLMNSTNKDNEIEFKKEWLSGMTSYAMPIIKKLLNEARDDYNHEEAA